jgi:cell volume regulation protein A
MISDFHIEYILVGASVLILISVFASKASGRLGVPSLLLFILIGMLAGSDGPGGIEFADFRLAQSLGVIALSFILFSGGLDTDWRRVRPVLGKGLVLSTLGVLITAVLVGLFAMLILDLSFIQGMLLGAIVSSTDAAAVFAVLRSKNVSLRGNLKPLLELESGSNDPMAVFLTIGLIRLLSDPTASMFDLIPMFVQQMAVGALLGYAMGKGMTYLVNRMRLEYEGLYPVLTLSLVLLTYGATASLGGNGFLAVYVAGLMMGNSDFIHKKSLMRFQDGVAWLMQITMFLTLGLLAFPSQLVPVIGAGLFISAFLIFIARPLAVFLTLSPFKMDLKEKLLLAWVGLRGAVPIVLATFPLLAGVPQADTLFNLVFFIVLTSALLQGSSIPWVARKLGVEAPLPDRSPYPITYGPNERVKGELIEIKIPSRSPVVGKQIVDVGFPREALIVLIRRKDEFLVSTGGTVLEPEDTLLILGDQEALSKVRSFIERDSSPEKERHLA